MLPSSAATMLLLAITGAVPVQDGPIDGVAFEELVRRSPVARAGDPGVLRVDLRFAVESPSVAITMRGLCRAEGDVLLIVLDDFDRTPIAWSDGRTLVVYDPDGARLLVGAVAGLSFRVRQSGDRGAVEFRLAETPAEHEAALAEQGGAFLIDLRSIVEADRGPRRSADRLADGSIRARIRAPSGRELEVTAAEDGPEIRWAARSDPEPDGSTFTLSVRVNGPAEDLLFERLRMPPRFVGLPVVELTDPRLGPARLANALTALGPLDRIVLRIVRARQAIREARARDLLADVIGEGATEWGQLLERDRLAAARLRASWGISGGDPIAPESGAGRGIP